MNGRLAQLPPPQKALQDLLLSLSLATLALLSPWDRVLAVPPLRLGASHFFQMGMGTLCFTLWYFLLLRLSARGGTGGRAGKLLVIATALFWLPDTLASIRGVTTGYLSISSALIRQGLSLQASRALIFGALIAAAIVLIAAFYRLRSTHLFRRGLVLLCPLALVLFGQLFLRYHERQAILQAKAALFPEARSRVVWLVFDELDQEYLARNLPALPAFRALWQDSLVASAAHAPANSTDVSVPTLWTGVPIHDASVSNRAGLVIKPTADAYWTRDWLPGRTVFDQLYQQGLGVRIVGWYLPYATLFPDRPGFSAEDTRSFTTPGPQANLFLWMLEDSIFVNQAYALLASRYRSNPARFESYLEHQPKAHLARRLQEAVAHQEATLLEALQDPKAALVFGHLAMPHLPRIDRKGRPAGSTPQADYEANLRVCDRLLGKVLAVLAQEQVPTLVLVTSDHWFRYDEALRLGTSKAVPGHRRPIPFLVHFTQTQDRPTAYARGFNTLHTRELVAAFLAGRLHGYQEAAAALDQWGDEATCFVQR